MSEDLLVGLDVGTTNVKAVAHRPDGTVVAQASRRLRSVRPKPGWEQYDAAEIDGAVTGSLRQLTDELDDPGAIQAIAVASMGETAFPLDRHDKPLHPALAWHDRRGAAEAAEFAERIGRRELYKITGLPPRHMFGVYKMMWLRAQVPDVAAKMRRWLNMAEYVAFRLSGELAMDRSLASRMSLLDLATGNLSDELLAAADIDASVLAPITDSGTAIGTVTAAASAATGLSERVVVSTGGHDHPCGALGMGVVDPGDLLDSIGTSESVLALTRAPVLNDAMADVGFEQGLYVVPGTSYVMGGVITSGAAIDWAARILGLTGARRQAELVELAATSRSGSGGVLFLPFLRMAGPPNNDGRARAAFLGMSDATSRAELARAVIEGLAYEFVVGLRSLVESFDVDVRRVLVFGGGAVNELGLAIKSGLFDIPIERATVAQSGALGAAILAGIGAGYFLDVGAAVDAMAAPADRLELVPDAPEVHAEAFERYTGLYKLLAPLHHEIADLEGALSDPLETRGPYR